MPGPKVPEFEITKVDGNMRNYVKNVSIDYAQDGPDMFSVTFLNQSAESQTEPVFTAGQYNGKFKEGDEITVQLGYKGEGGSMQKMLVGEVTSMEANFREHDPATFTVRGFDKLHRLSRGRKQRTFLNMKDSDIASQIAGEMGLGADVDDSGKVHDHVFQNNLSDIDFLYARARFIDFELDVEDNTLKFKRPQLSGGGGESFKWGENLKRVRFYSSTTKQIDEVQVRGWDPKEKKEIIGKAKAGDELSTMGGGQTGSQAQSGKYGGGQKVQLICNVPLTSQEEADRIAKARFNELAMEYLTGEAEVEGAMGVKAGKVVKFEGIGKQYDGDYYVISAVHTLKPGSGPGTGYITRLSFKRTAGN